MVLHVGNTIINDDKFLYIIALSAFCQADKTIKILSHFAGKIMKKNDGERRKAMINDRERWKVTMIKPKNDRNRGLG